MILKNTNIIKKVISTALCAVMACSFVTGAGISSMSLDMAVTASAAETEEKLCVTEKAPWPTLKATTRHLLATRQ